MTNSDFRDWFDRQNYEHWTHVYYDLCTPKGSVSGMRSHRPVPAEVARICEMIDVLNAVASAKCDADEVMTARALLVKWSGPRFIMPEGRIAWDTLRMNRMCALAGAVHVVAKSERAELVRQRAKAVSLIEGWGR